MAKNNPTIFPLSRIRRAFFLRPEKASTVPHLLSMLLSISGLAAAVFPSGGGALLAVPLLALGATIPMLSFAFLAKTQKDARRHMRQEFAPLAGLLSPHAAQLFALAKHQPSNGYRTPGGFQVKFDDSRGLDHPTLTLHLRAPDHVENVAVQISRKGEVTLDHVGYKIRHDPRHGAHGALVFPENEIADFIAHAKKELPILCGQTPQAAAAGPLPLSTLGGTPKYNFKALAKAAQKQLERGVHDKDVALLMGYAEAATDLHALAATGDAGDLADNLLPRALEPLQNWPVLVGPQNTPCPPELREVLQAILERFNSGRVALRAKLVARVAQNTQQALVLSDTLPDNGLAFDPEQTARVRALLDKAPA